MIEVEKSALLRCLSIDGQLRYELPGIFRGELNGYFIYARPNPLIIHYLKRKVFTLNYPEFILVSMTENHCISCGFDANGVLKNCYININLVPKEYEEGHEWNDLELDIKLWQGHDNRLHPYFVDWDEFEQSSLDESLKRLTEEEGAKMLNRIIKNQFPFNLATQPWLSLGPLNNR